MNTSTQHNPFEAPKATVNDIVSGEGIDREFKLNLFSPKGRIGRVRYWAYLTLFSVLLTPLTAFFEGTSYFIAIGIAYVALIYCNIMLTIKRCHDFNTTGWLSLLAVVPLINLIFLFIPGTDGPNRFGNKTPPNGRLTTVFIISLVSVFLLGIIAAIAIPAYYDYTKRAKSASGRNITTLEIPRAINQ